MDLSILQSLLYGVIFLLILVLAVYVIFTISQKKKPEIYSEFRFSRMRSLLTNAELDFFKALLEATSGKGVIICPKVRLGDILKVNENGEKYWRAMNKLNKKHVDFVICDREKLTILAGIELDDKLHEQPQAKQRDAFVNDAFKTAGLPLFRIKVQRSYNMQELKKTIAF